MPANSPIAPASVGRFALHFALAAALLLAACEAARGTRAVAMFVSGALNTPAAALLGVLAPGEAVDAVGSSLVSVAAQLNVVRGCDGLEALVLYAAAVLAWPGTPGQRAGALAIGLATLHVANLLRLVATWLVIRHAPASFAWVHGIVAPLGLVLIAAAVFSAYVTRTPRV